MTPSFEVTVPPLRSGAKIGSFRANFQDFCSYLFQYICNSLGTWRIVFLRMGSRGLMERKKDWRMERGGGNRGTKDRITR